MILLGGSNMVVYVGDKVQIKNGGIDVTNGNRATSGKYYGENGPLWATVDAIIEDWNTGGRYGLSSKVTKVRCSNNGVVVWQVRPQDIADNIIRASKPETVQTKAPDPAPSIPPTDQGKEDLTPPRTNTTEISGYKGDYAISNVRYDWGTGVKPVNQNSGSIPNILNPSTKRIENNPLTQGSKGYYEQTGTGTIRNLTGKEKLNIGPNSIKIDDSIKALKVQTMYQDTDKRKQLLNNDTGTIQNNYAFPALARPSKGVFASKYDYQIILDDNRYVNRSFEDKLMEARASLGIPVHGNNNIARAVKYYMYNRFKTPDLNLAHNKSVTYVFFTRPDLNLLSNVNNNHGNEYTANFQTLNHSESALIWKRNPELFKLLTDCTRCGDSNNFNMLLSNQVQSFDIKDEEITSVKAGMSWNDYEMVYGDSYTGRSAGTFSCNFAETSDYSVINLIKLWISYIDNVARGVWSPSYQLGPDRNGLNQSHVFTKTLDYAASAYVFKCGPDGEDVLYWSKYYGVFPMNTGANALSWDIGSSTGEAPKLNITFSYSYKRDLSPISLMEFNHIANIASSTDATSENSFDVNIAHSSRPYVGAPFIQMNLNPESSISGNGLNYERGNSSIRLKFRKTADTNLSDELLYHNSLGSRFRNSHNLQYKDI